MKKINNKENNMYNFDNAVESEILPKGMTLYRHVDVSPSKCRLGMSQNKGKTGRCNYHQNIYYCAKSIDAIKQERNFDNELTGSIIISKVMEPISLGKIINKHIHTVLRGRTKNEEPQLVHTEFLQKIDSDVITTYETTNFITRCILSAYPDGIIYSSINSIDIIAGNNYFQMTEDTGWSNIALTEKGYAKIKEIEVYDISKYTKNHNVCPFLSNPTLLYRNP
jgi:hypothetical protein